LPQSEREGLKRAYLFASKVPQQEREDMLQELTLALLESGLDDPRLQYIRARQVWIDWYRRYKTREHYGGMSLDYDLGDGHTLGEYLVSGVAFENEVNGELDGRRLYASLPDGLKPVVAKRLSGKALTPAERQRLSRFARQHIELLAY